MSKTKNKPADLQGNIAELTHYVQHLASQLVQHDTEYIKKLKDLQTSFHSLRLEQTQISDRLAKFERRKTIF